jgi:5'-3' exonuclease
MMALYATHKPIVLWDGASWRTKMFAEYKLNREKADTIHEKRMLAAKDEFARQRDAIKKGYNLLGIDQVQAFNMEADDLAAIMTDLYVKRGDKVVLLTGDRDWIQLVQPGVIWVDPINDRKVTMSNFEEMTGVADPSQFVEAKCLMGDQGDNIPGVGKVGEKGAKEFLATFGSFANFSNMALDGSLDVKKLPKKYRDLAEDEGKRIIFSRNMALMDLRTKDRPAPINLRVTAGEPDADKFKVYCTTLLFKSIINDPYWISVFPAFAELFMENAA